MLPAALVALLLMCGSVAAADQGRINVFVDCRCPDQVGQTFCNGLKQQVHDSAGYLLASNANGYGMGVHLACVDLWQGIENQLAGTMSAISLTFTIYSDKLPGEVYEDSSVFRVGKDATDEISRKVMAALGQLVGMNASLFDRLRENTQKPAPKN